MTAIGETDQIFSILSEHSQKLDYDKLSQVIRKMRFKLLLVII